MAVANTLVGNYPAGVVEHVFQVPIHAAATATEVTALGSFPKAFNVKTVYHQPTAAITGADTNTTHLNVDEAGTEKCNIDYVASTDAAANTRTTLSATAWTVTAGALLELEYEKVGNGLEIPNGLIIFVGEWA